MGRRGYDRRVSHPRSSSVGRDPSWDILSRLSSDREEKKIKDRERERERKRAYRQRLNRARIEVFTIQRLDDRPMRNFHPLPGFRTVNRNNGTWRISRYDAVSRARASDTKKKRWKKKREREKRAVAHGFVRTRAPATWTRGTKTSVIFEGTKRARVSVWCVVSRTRTPFGS